MLQKQIDIIARFIVQAIASPFQVLMTTLEKYMNWIGSNQRNLYLHFFFLSALIIIAFLHFYL